ncbi:MAG: hypothetical protein IV100_14440 [Myxococcales bacterium]|nr:hypothetical protein [Myxococcales bacterium]
MKLGPSGAAKASILPHPLLSTADVVVMSGQNCDPCKELVKALVTSLPPAANLLVQFEIRSDAANEYPDAVNGRPRTRGIVGGLNRARLWKAVDGPPEYAGAAPWAITQRQGRVATAYFGNAPQAIAAAIVRDLARSAANDALAIGVADFVVPALSCKARRKASPKPRSTSPATTSNPAGGAIRKPATRMEK